ncbi:MAG: RnfH family protein [Burkholderiaceae bacterium]
MVEPAPDRSLAVELIWVDHDWSDASPLSASGLVGNEPVRHDVHGMSGLDARQPVLSAATLRVAGPCSLGEFIARYLNPVAVDRLNQGDVGVAVFGRRGRRDQLLRSGDRVELLGPITADPKSDRQARVKAGRSLSDRDKWRTRPAG